MAHQSDSGEQQAAEAQLLSKLLTRIGVELAQGSLTLPSGVKVGVMAGFRQIPERNPAESAFNTSDPQKRSTGISHCYMTVKAREKYIKIFRKIDSLAAPISCSTGVSNLVEWLLWSTNDVLGVPTTKCCKKIVAWCDDEVVQHGGLEAKQRLVDEQLMAELTPARNPIIPSNTCQWCLKWGQ